MKQITLLAIFWLLVSNNAIAEGDMHKTVNCGAAPLESLLTEVEKKSVTHLTITGELLPEDYAFLRQKLLGQLKELNLKDAQIETLPAGAFQWKRDSPHYCLGIKIVLPQTLKRLEDSSLRIDGQLCTFEITGRFPTLGKHVFPYWDEFYTFYSEYEAYDQITASPDSPYCKFVPWRGVFSADMDTLYRSSTIILDDHCLEGTKVIAPHAYEGVFMCHIEYSIPASVEAIGDSAFFNVTYNVILDGKRRPYYVHNRAKTPQQLGKDNFCGDDYFYDEYLFTVPDESYEAYKAADGWKGLRICKESEFGTQSIEVISAKGQTTMQHVGNELRIHSDENINDIQILDNAGTILSNTSVNGHDCTIPAPGHQHHVFMVKLTFADGTEKTYKVANK